MAAGTFLFSGLCSSSNVSGCRSFVLHVPSYELSLYLSNSRPSPPADPLPRPSPGHEARAGDGCRPALSARVHPRHVLFHIDENSTGGSHSHHTLYGRLASVRSRDADWSIWPPGQPITVGDGTAGRIRQVQRGFQSGGVRDYTSPLQKNGKNGWIGMVGEGEGGRMMG